MKLRTLVLSVALWTVLLTLSARRLDFWGDEIGSILGAAEPAGEILKGHGSDFHPPLYFFLLHYWMHLFGETEVAVRSLSILCAGLGIVLTWLLGRERGLRWPMLAVVFLALSPFWVLFSGMARYYSLSATVYVAGLWAFGRAVGTSSAPRWVLSGVFLALAGFTNYIMFTSAVILQGIVVLGTRNRIALRPWLLSLGFAAFLLLPMMALAAGQTRKMYLWGEEASFATLPRTVLMGLLYPVYVLAVSETVLPWQVWISVPLLLMSGYLFVNGRHSRIVLKAFVVGALVGVAVVSCVARSLPLVYLPSRLLFLAPLWAILLARGVERVGKREIVATSVVLLGYAAGLWNLHQGSGYHNASYLIPWRQAAQVMLDDPEPSKLVVTTEEYPLFHYGDGLRFQLVRPGHDAVSELASRFPRAAWLVERDRADRQRQDLIDHVEQWLIKNYVERECREFVPLSAMESRARQLFSGRKPASAALTLTRYDRP
jgi:4-amino-4-deoxy-L-arabinose transferase-like glycosyltransferase